MEYKITFGNNSSVTAAVVSVRDFLPENLEYVSSQIVITNVNSDHTNGTQGGVFVDIYGNMTIPAGVSGYLLVK